MRNGITSDGMPKLETIRQSLTDGKGNTVPLQLEVPVVASTGFGSPMVVILPPGETFTFPIDLLAGMLPLAPGQYTLSAVYNNEITGLSARKRSYLAFNRMGYMGSRPDGKSTTLDPTTTYWTGTVTSNTVPFIVSQKTAQ